MEQVILVIHLLVSIAMVAVILLQRSEGGALGIGGGGGGFMTGRSAANLLTRTTAILAVAFFLTSISLTILAGSSGNSSSITDRIQPGVNKTPAATTEKKVEGAKTGDKAPAKKPEGPSAPTSD